jgi:prepilin-type N-terminal cleavage/methylation domain-containing protein
MGVLAKNPQRRAFTLVELLVVVTIISILVGLLLPAVQSAREAGRAAQCRNNLHQLGVAMTSHENACGVYPSGGWGYLWVGDPDRGTGIEQPGGWIYNILAHMGQQSLRDRGLALAEPQKKQELCKAMQTALPELSCPTRSGPSPGPANSSLAFNNADSAESVVKTDYAVNGGDFYLSCVPGPTYSEAGPNYSWPIIKDATGISYVRSRVATAEVLDGLSTTYMIGEKFVNQLYYDTGLDLGYDQSALSGMCVDTTRWGGFTMPSGEVVGLAPLRDYPASWFGSGFG